MRRFVAQVALLSAAVGLAVTTRVHRGRPALVRGQSKTDVLGSDGKPWSPKAELEAAEAAKAAEPDETIAEATLREFTREFAEIVDHWAAEYDRYAADTRAWFDKLVEDDPIAAQYLAEGRERVARKASVDVADALSIPTGEMPVLALAVTA
jgi:hypothetical protein